jgi:type IV pilus assembly protein PilA
MISLKSRKNRRGFTLVELLVVVLILATLMAVALPLYLSSVADSSKKTCRANMQSIANAAQAWKVKTRSANFSSLTISDLTPDLGATPVCPDGGAYSISTSGTVNDEGGTATAIPTDSLGISCNHTGHNGFIPGVMSK